MRVTPAPLGALRLQGQGTMMPSLWRHNLPKGGWLAHGTTMPSLWTHTWPKVWAGAGHATGTPSWKHTGPKVWARHAPWAALQVVPTGHCLVVCVEPSALHALNVWPLQLAAPALQSRQFPALQPKTHACWTTMPPRQT